jgi:hypothetical protein
MSGELLLMMSLQPKNHVEGTKKFRWEAGVELWQCDRMVATLKTIPD